MLATLDLAAVRRFTDDVNAKLRRCDNGDGMICSTLEQRILNYVGICDEFRQCIHQWARGIFTGQVEFDPNVENLLKAEARNLLRHATQVAALGRAMNGQCFELQGLNDLHFYVADFAYLLDNWVSPRVAAGPSPRLARFPEATERQVGERLKKLSRSPNL